MPAHAREGIAVAAEANTRLAEAIDALLPQTQCTRCGFPTCRAYADAIAQDAADIDRCPPGAGETHVTELSSRTTWEGGVGGTRVTAWTVTGGGHAWPGAPIPPEWNVPNTREFDAAEEICRFATPLLASADARRR